MKPLVLPSGKTVNVPSTADDWQLYTVSMACGRAALALTSALVRVLKDIDQHVTQGYAPTPEGAQMLYRTVIEPVMSRYAKCGAYDTEPRGVAYDAIERTVRRLTDLHVELF
jgi:hypothetical protein